MKIDLLREQFPNEAACFRFIESVIWKNGRTCPHCMSDKSYKLKGASVGRGLYECAQCRRQSRVTCRTPLHSTKLSLGRWLPAMYYIMNSSKGTSSVYLGKLVGISQKSEWKIGHAIRKMMGPGSHFVPSLGGVVELDEKYIGGKPRLQRGVSHKRGKGTGTQNQ